MFDSMQTNVSNLGQSKTLDNNEAKIPEIDLVVTRTKPPQQHGKKLHKRNQGRRSQSVFLFRSEKFEAENFKFEPSEAFLSAILTQQ